MSKTFKALQRAAEERAKKSDPNPNSISGPEPSSLPLDSGDSTTTIVEPEALREEANRVAEEIARTVEDLDRIQSEREQALRDAALAKAASQAASLEAERASAAELAAREAERAAAEREQAAREAGQRAEEERVAEESARFAAHREREVLESVKTAVAEERAAQENARAAMEKERLALESLKIELETSKLPEFSKKSPPPASGHRAETSLEDPAITDSDPLAGLPALDDRFPDPALQNLLRSELVRSSDPFPVKVGPFGRVVGPLDAHRSAALLSRYALLHCVKEGRDVHLWFWANGKEARDYAAKRELPLDEDALAARGESAT